MCILDPRSWIADGGRRLPCWAASLWQWLNEDFTQFGWGPITPRAPCIGIHAHDSHGGVADAGGRRASAIDMQSRLDAPTGAAGGKGRDAIERMNSRPRMVRRPVDEGVIKQCTVPFSALGE